MIQRHETSLPSMVAVVVPKAIVIEVMVAQ